MKRPYVDLKENNIVWELKAALKANMQHFMALEGIVGIVLDGGLSRGYGDHLSEIDVVIYLRDKAYRAYSGAVCPIALGITVVNGYLYDIKIANFDDEKRREPDSVGLWDLSYAEILYDPAGEVAGYLREKLSKPVQPSEAGGHLWSAYWYYKLAGDIWIHRKDILQGHYTFNHAIKPLLCALFIANHEYTPHDKWLVHMSKSLAWQPENWEAHLQGAMATGDFSLQSLVDRQRHIAFIWEAVNDRLCQEAGYDGELDFVQQPVYALLKRLAQNDEYTLDAWQAVTSLAKLNGEPFHSLFKQKGGKIVWDKDALIRLKPEDMYVWMYAIAAKVRDAL